MILKIVTLLLGNVIALLHALDVATDKTKIIVNDNLSKRDLKPDEVSSKSFDPQPEYYRGPGSIFEHDRNKDRDVVGLNRPFTPSSYGHDTRYPTKGDIGSSYYDGNRRPSQDRVGHYGPSSSAEGSSYYSDSGHKYGHIPYGQPQPIDFTSNYAGGTGPTGYEKLPPGHYLPEHPVGFDLYSKGYGDYGHSHPPPTDYYHYHKTDLAKSFLIPLAGAAILGITAALIANPVLLQLGTVSAGKRRRRDLNEKTKFTGKSNAHKLAYNAYGRN